MSRRLNRVWLIAPFLFVVYQAWALGLGDIRLSSALNQPLRAEIELLAATPEELNNLTVQLASQDTFDRYDLDRPIFLTELQFEIVRSGRADGNVIRITSPSPITEPFITFLVEASWSRGRLLREYTLLLDPPTFAPPPTTDSMEAVTAPTRAAPADSGQIQRPAPQPQTTPPPARPPAQPPVQAPVTTAVPEPQPEPEPTPLEPDTPAPEPTPEPAPEPEVTSQLSGLPFDTAAGGDVLVVRGDTLWGITQRVRPDSRLTINQTMMAIYEANPDAFEGNINRLRAGATLRIPSAEDIFTIRRADAFAEVLRQNQEWRGETPTIEPTPSPAPEPIAPPEETAPSLTLVPPDEEDAIDLSDTSVETGTAEVTDEVSAEAPVDPEARIQEIEAILDDPAALIAIPDNELAALRQELADLRGEELPVETTDVDDTMAEDDAALDAAGPEDDTAVEEPVADTAPTVQPAPQVVSQPPQESMVDTILGYLNNFWVWIGGALIVTVGILFWFMRRAANREDEDVTGVWDALDADEMMDDGDLASTERLKALARDEESIVVVETESPEAEPGFAAISDTMEVPAAEEPDLPTDFEAPIDFTAPETEEPTTPAEVDEPTFDPTEADEPTYEPTEVDEPTFDPTAATGMNKALEDTFSSETAINLDQSDPVAEADFHMAYGLYDQAADLINGALTNEPERLDLLAKLCEIYFVWGNRDGFIDAAMSMKALVGDGADAEWDKIVIMGQQIAADHEMFSGVSAEGVTKAVDLSFESGMEESGDLDIDFAGGSDDAGDSDVIDLGAEEDDVVDLGAVTDTDEDDVIDLGAAAVPADELATDETGQVLIPPDTGSGIDFSLDDDEPSLEASATREMPTTEMSMDEAGETTQVSSDDSVRTPTIEQQFDMEATGELPAMPDTGSDATVDIPPADATAEIDLDDLGLDLDGLEETAMAADVEEPDDDDGLSTDDYLEATGRHEAADDLEATGRHEMTEATSIQETLQVTDDDGSSTGVREALNVEEELTGTGDLPMLDDDGDTTGIRQALSDDDATQLASLDDEDDDTAGDTSVGLDTSLLDATGQTQILTEDMAVQTATDIDANIGDADATMLAPSASDDEPNPVSSDAATLLAPMDEDEDDGDFDFAKTEALPKDVFSPDMTTDDTGRMPGLAGSTDMDLDLDDLTAALKVSEVGDTVNQLRDDATVEQPRIKPGQVADDDGPTQSIAPEDMSGDLHEARTMTEVGTKLDLARAYVDMGDPAGARSILEEVLDEGDEGQKQQAQQLIDSLPA